MLTVASILALLSASLAPLSAGPAASPLATASAEMYLIPRSGSTPGVTTCPAGDCLWYHDLVVYVHDTGGNPVQGVPSSSFEFTTVGGELEIAATHPPETGSDGALRFGVGDLEPIAHPLGPLPGSPVDIFCRLDGEPLPSGVSIICNTVDYTLDGEVGPVDFGLFATDFGSTSQRSDFNWDGLVDPLDFAVFTEHWGHTASRETRPQADPEQWGINTGRSSAQLPD